VIEALSKLSRVRALVVGDLMLDRYLWGEVRRVSPEAPVPVVRVTGEELRLGGAANVAHNLAALGCRVTQVGLVGEDADGARLVERLRQLGVDPSAVQRDGSRPTTVKLRVMAQQQQMLRCDWEQTRPVPPGLEGRLLSRVEAALPSHDGLIVSDYAKGLVTEGLMRGLVSLARRAGKPIVADPKGADYAKYRGATCLTPNQHEALAAARAESADGEAETLAIGRKLIAEFELARLCITRGAQGVLALTREGENRFIPAQAREVYDVTGAGDTFLSVLGALMLAGVPFFEAVAPANVAAGVAVGKLGTATVSVSEILSHPEHAPRLYTLREIGPVAEALRARRKRIVFTNGCFDLLHAGHIDYLRRSRALGDILIVGINSDDSVRRLKGPGRPLIGEEDRAHVLSALSFVDHVVVFEEDTPLELIRAIRPDVLTKGADYTVETVVGHELVQSWGGEVKLIPLLENRSTTGIVEKIRAGARAGK
jgi:D-beta-D-heptose 7-phosphate kinase/D-beta-D-heptose 1-phosphate adenosyltransferase